MRGGKHFDSGKEKGGFEGEMTMHYIFKQKNLPTYFGLF